jgi:hypothetical protein
VPTSYGHAGARPLQLPTHIPCVTPDLILKHSDAIPAIYKKKTDKTLEIPSETLAKTLENHCKHTHHSNKTLTTYV